MDIVYYSNYCKHSQKLLQYLAKNGLTTKVNCINIDKRKRDSATGQTHIYLEKGGAVLLPPNVHCVPTLLLVNEKFRVITGQEIYSHFAPKVTVQNKIATNGDEPESYMLPFSQNGIQSEQYTFYNMTPEELSAKGKGGMRQMYNYVSAFTDNMSINTPPDDYRPNKVSAESVEALEQTRNNEMNRGPPTANPALPPQYMNNANVPPPQQNQFQYPSYTTQDQAAVIPRYA
jgi:hypothetical protein